MHTAALTIAANNVKSTAKADLFFVSKITGFL
jgi:hypothetical protein